MHLRRAAQRVGVLHAGALRAAVAGHDRRCRRAAPAGWPPSRPDPGAAAARCRSAANTASVPSSASTLIAAATSAVVSSRRRSASASTQHAEHAVGAVDQRQALLLGQLHRLDAVRRAARRRPARRTPSASRTSPSPMSASATDESGARSPEQPSEPYSWTTGVMPGVEHRGVGPGGLRADAGAPGGQRREPQQHQRAHDLALDLGARAGRVRADQAALQLGPPLERDVRGGQRAEAGGDPVVRLVVLGQARRRRPGCGRSRPAPRRPAGRPAPSRATRTTSSGVTGPVPTTTWSVRMGPIAHRDHVVA